MLREKPPIADSVIATCLERGYGLDVAAVTFLPLGYDPNAAVYRIETHDGTPYFLKLTRSAIVPASLQLPRTLIDRGISNVLAPLRTMQDELWCACGAERAILYPFIAGENAKKRGMSRQQWHAFGTTLNAIHSTDAAEFANSIPRETFASPAIGLVRSMQEQVKTIEFDLAVQQEFVAFWHQHAALIRQLTDRSEQLGTMLRTQNLPLMLCHGDIHAANIMLADNGDLYLVDWDTPRIAPRERDLLFVVGSPIARRVTPHEEALFFAGYGPISIHRPALTYYRYERALEDLYEGGRSIFFNRSSSVAVKQADAQLTISLFQPGDIVELALAGDQHGT